VAVPAFNERTTVRGFVGGETLLAIYGSLDCEDPLLFFKNF
jgi:hypothetical protein